MALLGMDCPGLQLKFEMMKVIYGNLPSHEKLENHGRFVDGDCKILYFQKLLQVVYYSLLQFAHESVTLRGS
jgi:hypothetical protein